MTNTVVVANPVSWDVKGAESLSPGTSFPIRIEAVEQKDKSYLYAIRWGSRTCLNKYGDWEYEPQVSLRNRSFIHSCRYRTLDIALDHIRMCLAQQQRKGKVKK